MPFQPPRYVGEPSDAWLAETLRAIRAHPLKRHELAQLVSDAWKSIFDSRFGSGGFRIGVEIFPSPQIIAFLLHELLALELVQAHPSKWRRDLTADEKDLVYIADDRFSIEVKASSHKTQVFGNRSYAQPAASPKKSKAGYYLTVNFTKPTPDVPAELRKAAFGWLDHRDWIAQSAATGQQARLARHVYKYKLVELDLP